MFSHSASSMLAHYSLFHLYRIPLFSQCQSRSFRTECLDQWWFDHCHRRKQCDRKRNSGLYFVSSVALPTTRWPLSSQTMLEQQPLLAAIVVSSPPGPLAVRLNDCRRPHGQGKMPQWLIDCWATRPAHMLYIPNHWDRDTLSRRNDKSHTIAAWWASKWHVCHATTATYRERTNEDHSVMGLSHRNAPDRLCNIFPRTKIDFQRILQNRKEKRKYWFNLTNII